MRKTVHLCLSSHDEVMFRSEADLVMGFNCFALATLTTESRALAEGRMSTHHHSMAQTDNAKELMYRNRNAYSRYFNTKYRRKGRLGEKQFFLLEIEGLHHTIAALNYVNRQGLHHGLAVTPFDYPHCSANAFFQKQLGKQSLPELLPPSLRYHYLPSNIILPPQFRMSESGLILPIDVLDTAYAEELYISPRNYLYQMNRLSYEEEIRVQKEENQTEPITLESVEAGVPDFDLSQTKTFVQGRVNHSWMTDLELCRLIDERLLPKISSNPDAVSIYDIPFDKRVKLYDWLWQKNQSARYQRNDPLFTGKTITEAQLSRCLCMKYDPKR